MWTECLQANWQVRIYLSLSLHFINLDLDKGKQLPFISGGKGEYECFESQNSQLILVVRKQSVLYLVYVSDGFTQEAVIFYHVCPSKATEMALTQQHNVLSVSSRAQPFGQWTSVRFSDFTKDLTYSTEPVFWAIIEDITSVPLFVPGFYLLRFIYGPGI